MESNFSTRAGNMEASNMLGKQKTSPGVRFGDDSLNLSWQPLVDELRTFYTANSNDNAL
jgi:hypothetical protein